jgi:hypothetical protein
MKEKDFASVKRCEKCANRDNERDQLCDGTKMRLWTLIL